MSPNTVTSCWTIFKDMVWQSDSVTTLLYSPSKLFQGYGHLHGLSKCSCTVPCHMPTVFPSCVHSVPARPVLHSCWLSAYIKGHANNAHRATAGVLYTSSEGPVPVHSIHLYCEGGIKLISWLLVSQCTYMLFSLPNQLPPNFKVVKGKHIYYSGIPNTIQTSEHQFVECQVIEMWITLMDTWCAVPCPVWQFCAHLLTRSLVTTCMHFYNTAMSCSNQPPTGWQFSFTLTSEHIWSVFLIYSLLEDAIDHQEYLVLSHIGEHRDWFNDTIRAWNQRMHLHGQLELTHFCNKCT